jgi:hypothetical protein
MAKKTKVISSSNKPFVHAGGKVNVSNSSSRTKIHGKGLGTPGGNVGKQTSKPLQPR